MRPLITGTAAWLSNARILISVADLASFCSPAGLEEYARPIIDAIDPEGTTISHRLYREATLRTDYYQ